MLTIFASPPSGCDTPSRPRHLRPLKSKSTSTAASSPSTLLDSPTSTCSLPSTPNTPDSLRSPVAKIDCEVPDCPATYQGNPKWCGTSLRRHKKLVHARFQKVYWCKFCKQDFNRSDNRLDHVRGYHGDVWKKGEKLGWEEEKEIIADGRVKKGRGRRVSSGARVKT